MHYMLTPLDKHSDLGFGAVADSFMESALDLMSPADGIPHLNSHLPISYLFRHSIELFLKSSIVILHKALELPYGPLPFDGEPQVLIGEKWKPMYTVHGLVPLNNYARKLFVEHAATLKAHTKMDWDIGSEFEGWINAIEATDSSSTFFRYPVTKHKGQDKDKSVMKQDDISNIMARMGPGMPAQKAFIVLDENEDVTSAFHYDDKGAKEIIEVLKVAADRLYGFHAAMRHEITGGR